MNTIKDNYIKREAQHKAAQYLAEKEYQRQQISESRRDFVIIAFGGILIALLIGSFINA